MAKKYGILGTIDQYEEVTFKPDGTPIDDAFVTANTEVYRKGKNGQYYASKEFGKGKTPNIRDYGIKGDGTAENVAALQKYIDAVYQLGLKKAVFNEGDTYNITGQVQLPGDLEIEGNGCKVITSGVVFNSEVAIENLSIRNFTVECTNAANQNFIRLNNATKNATIEGIKAKNASIVYFRGESVVHENIRIVNCTADLVDGTLNGVHIGKTKNLTIDKLIVSNTQADGVKFGAEFTEKISITNSFFINCLDDGIDFYGGGREATISNCFFIGCDNGINTKRYGEGANPMNVPLDKFTITGNHFYNTNYMPLIVYGGTRKIIITGNQIHTAATDAAMGTATVFNLSGTIADVDISHNQIHGVKGGVLFGLYPAYTAEEPYSAGAFEINAKVNISHNIINDESILDFMRIECPQNISLNLNFEGNSVVRKGAATTCIRITGDVTKPSAYSFVNNTFEGYTTLLRASNAALTSQGYTVNAYLNKAINVVVPVNNPAYVAVNERYNSWNIQKVRSETSVMPTAGSYTAGDYVPKSSIVVAGTGYNRYILKGWQRIKTGSAHVLGVDWIEDRLPYYIGSETNLINYSQQDGTVGVLPTGDNELIEVNPTANRSVVVQHIASTTVTGVRKKIRRGNTNAFTVTITLQADVTVQGATFPLTLDKQGDEIELVHTGNNVWVVVSRTRNRQAAFVADSAAADIAGANASINALRDALIAAGLMASI